MVNETERFSVQLSGLVAKIRANGSKVISRKGLRAQSTAISKRWLQHLSPRIRATGRVDDSTLNQLDSSFEKVLSLSSSNNRKNSYLKLLRSAAQSIQQSVLVPLIKTAPTTSLFEGVAVKVLTQQLSTEQRQYIEEAFTAARAGCFKASTVVTWCAAIDKLRSFVLVQGLDVYSHTSATLKQNGTGFYKHFKNEVSISTENELQEIFDRNLIIVISAINNALDVNQAKALLGLFDRRNASAHPSATVVDELAFTSYLSELNNLVFANPKLA